MRYGAALVALLLLGTGRPAMAGAATVLVVNTGGDSVSVVDLEAGKEIARHDVGKEPYGVVVSTDGRTVAVGVEGEGKVKFFSYPAFEPKGEVAFGPMHHDHMVLSPDGKHVLVASYHGDAVVGLDVRTMQESFRIRGTSAPHVVKYEPGRKRAWVTCKKITGVASVDPIAREVVSFHQTNVNPRSLTFSPDASKLYFASFWVDGFFEMDAERGEVVRLFHLPPPEGSPGPLEVTYHGVELVGGHTVIAANEGRSYLDAVDVRSGALLDRLSEVAKPCCVETIPGGEPPRVLVSNIANASVQIVEVGPDGTLTSRSRIGVGEAPKRVAFLPAHPSR